MTAALFRCDSAKVPGHVSRRSRAVPEDINRLGRSNLTLRIENISHAFRSRLDNLTIDLLHIAAYVYAADQLVGRGGDTDYLGDDWRREMTLCIPVTNPGFWSDKTIKGELSEVLHFATDDHWSFHFSQARPEQEQLLFDRSGAELMDRPDSVLLFSGGADSLCAAVEEVAVNGRRPALVSHRPAPLTDRRQRDLRNLLRRELPAWEFPYTSVWVQRKGSPPKDSAQRSRAFLYATLGAAVAESIGVRRVVLADNGIVSLNLPINDQLLGAKASRSTHPKFLDGMNRLLQQVIPGKPELSNPLAERTRAECLQILSAAGLERLLQESNSCSNWRGKPKVTPQCGVCYQCVDRRFASIAAGLTEHDLGSRYVHDVFRQALAEGRQRLVATSYVKFARKISKIANDDEFSLEIGELADCVPSNDPDPDATLLSIIDMLKRHSHTVLEALAHEISRAGEELAFEHLPPTCLIRLSLQPEEAVAPLPTSVSPQLTAEEELVFKKHGFQSRLLIEINGTLSSRKSNVVVVGGAEAVLDDADFVPFLRLVLALLKSEDGFLAREELRYGAGLDGEAALMPQGLDQALSRMRKSFRGRIGSLSPKQFIEMQRGRVRLSTHAKLVEVDCDAFAAAPGRPRPAARPADQECASSCPSTWVTRARERPFLRANSARLPSIPDARSCSHCWERPGN